MERTGDIKLKRPRQQTGLNEKHDIIVVLDGFEKAVSVAVSAWTLVAISVERYYAICHPFKSRRWQTLSHAHRIIAVIWMTSLVCMTPIAVLSLLQPLGDSGRSKCREEWPSDVAEKAFNLFLDATLLVIPLLIMVITYSLIIATLWKGIKTEFKRNGDDSRHSTSLANGTVVRSATSSDETIDAGKTSWEMSGAKPAQIMRHTNVSVSLANKKRVIKMLFVVVLEFFVCWTPLHVVNTLALFSPRLVYQDLGYVAISFFQLVAYASSCCNPITYCFMNAKFRNSFLSAFRWQRRRLSLEHKISASTSNVNNRN